ncbi:MAG TPA: GNAT family N-acetyltransferase [Streptosporangiaceae bacterium]
MSLFCDTALAGRIERAEAQLMAAASAAARRRAAGGAVTGTEGGTGAPDPAGFVTPIAGGVASFAEDGSPFNKVAGLGFGGVPGPGELEEIERAFAACHAPVQVELAHLADPAVGALLTGRGYRLVSFENVLGLALADRPGRAIPAGVEVRRGGDFRPWLEAVAEASIHPDTEGVPSHEEFPRELIENAERDLVAAGATPYLALRDGIVAGGASVRLAEDGVAQFTGAATLPAHRRRGVQTALLAARLAAAAAAGCDIAVVTTQPGSKSQQNVQRRGFDLLYTRAVLVRDLRASARH